jgi:hypothetical protein
VLQIAPSDLIRSENHVGDGRAGPPARRCLCRGVGDGGSRGQAAGWRVTL